MSPQHSDDTYRCSVRCRLKLEPVLQEPEAVPASVPAPAVQLPAPVKAPVVSASVPIEPSTPIARAAAAYTNASTDYAKAFVAVESLKAQLMIEEANLSKALKERQAAEADMQGLTEGRIT